jgi:hypothetical protein
LGYPANCSTLKKGLSSAGGCLPVDNCPSRHPFIGLSGTDRRLIRNDRGVYQEQTIGLSGTGGFCIPLILFPESGQ